MAFREYTVKLLEAIQAGMIDREAVITAALQHMSEDEVKDMCEAEGWFEHEDEEEEDSHPQPDPIDDFNYVGSRHHY
jgi:hypothetical protein